jgi:excisionase family DNA binding protein
MIRSAPHSSHPSTLPYVLTLEEAAELLRIAPQTLEELVARGEVPGRRIEKEYRFLRSALEVWLEGLSARRTVIGLAGALKGDPYFPAILDEVKKSRQKATRRRT